MSGIREKHTVGRSPLEFHVHWLLAIIRWRHELARREYSDTELHQPAGLRLLLPGDAAQQRVGPMTVLHKAFWKWLMTTVDSRARRLVVSEGKQKIFIALITNFLVTSSFQSFPFGFVRLSEQLISSRPLKLTEN